MPPVTTLVGRDAPVARLVEALDDALTTRGRLMLVSGDGGIGKTALAEEISSRARALGAPALWGRCLEGEGAPPYWPWLQVLRSLPGAPEPPVVAGTQAGRYEFFDWACRELKQAALPAGLLVVVDDLHWADEPSLVFLQYLAGELAGTRILVVANYRAADLRPLDPLSRSLPDLLRERTSGQVALGGLDQSQVAELIGRVLERRPPDGLASLVYERTEGNPFFTIEMARLLSSGADAAHLPDSVRQVVRRRIERLPPDCADTLKTASVIGRTFELELLGEVTGQTTRRVLETLDPALEARLLSLTKGGATEARFAHALIRETLYEDLPASRRIDVHRKVGVVLEGRGFKSPEHLTELATHFFRSLPLGDATKVVDYAERAAVDAQRRSAFEEAARLYRMAIEALGPALERRRADLLLSLARVLDLSDQQAAGLEASEDLVEVATRLNEAELAAQAALVSEGVFTLDPDARRLRGICEKALALLADGRPDLRARVLAQLSIAMHFADDERRERLARQALDVAEASGDPVALASALFAMQLRPWGLQKPEDRYRIGDRLLEIGLETSNRKTELWGHFWRASALFEVGDLSTFDAEIDRYGQVADEIKDPSARWRTSLFRGARAQMCGQFAEAQRHASEVRASSLPTQIGTVQIMRGALMAGIKGQQGNYADVLAAMEEAQRLGANITVRSIHAYALAGLGRLDEARAMLDQITAPDVRTTPRAHTWPITMGHLAETAVMLKDVPLMESLYEMLLPYPRSNAVAAAGSAAGYGSISRYLGLLALALGRPEDAISHYEVAVEMNQVQSALPSLALSELGLAEALALRGKSGDKARAASLLAQAKERGERLGMSGLLERATALSTQLEPWAGRGPLSARESEVAVLVADGLTNRQISERLHLSVRTAENHVENICNKLGFTSRAQIAAWAVERGMIKRGARQ